MCTCVKNEKMLKRLGFLCYELLKICCDNKGMDLFVVMPLIKSCYGEI
jgi:hypothetical protein